MCLNVKLQCLLITLLLSVATTAAQTQLRRAIDIRTLPYERSLEKLPVELTATVGFVESGGTVFVQDETAGTHLHFKPARNDLSVGDRVHIKGITMAGLYLPGIEVTELQVLGHESPPVSVHATYDDLATGRFHYQRVEIEGLGRSLTQLDENRSLLRLAIGNRVLEVRIDAPINASPTLVDATLRITALAAGGINDRRQLVFPYLRVTDWSDIAMISPGKPFNELPRVSVTNLLRFTGKPDEAAHRVLINGVVLAQFPDGRLFARDHTPAEPSSPTSADLVSEATPPAICIKLDAQSDLNPGDNFVASGFPVMEGFTASLADSHLIEILSGSTPVPVDVSLSALLNGSHDADLVRLDRPVTLLDQFRTSEGYELRLNCNGTTVHAFMPRE